MTLDPHLHTIVAAQPYPLLFATISGAHLYGFPSPDSDSNAPAPNFRPPTTPANFRMPKSCLHARRS